MTERHVVGLGPWLPWPLERWRWLTEPIRAERVAVLRIGVALVLLLDIGTTILPYATELYGPDVVVKQSVGWRWSLLSGSPVDRILHAALWLWIATTASLLVGFCSRISAVLAWLLATSFANLNPTIANAGDEIRGILLFYLMLSPCGTAWSIDAWRRRTASPVFIWPWPLRLLFLQLVLIYCTNGLTKLLGPQWRAGDSLYYVLTDLTLTRWSYVQIPLPYALTRFLTWLVLAWEVGFPLWVLLRWTRAIALWMGVAFHAGIFIVLELGMFGPYMLCFYLPLVRWERWAAAREETVEVSCDSRAPLSGCGQTQA